MPTHHWSQLPGGARFYSLWPISTRIWGDLTPTFRITQKSIDMLEAGVAPPPAKKPRPPTKQRPSLLLKQPCSTEHSLDGTPRRLGFWYSHRHFMDDSSNIRLEVVDFAFCPQGCGSYLGPLWIPKGRGNPVALSLSAMLVHSWVHWEPNSAPTCSDYGLP